MGYSIVQSRATHFVSSGNNVDQFASNVTAGSALFCVIHNWYSGGYVAMSVADDQNGSWTEIGHVTMYGGAETLYLFSCLNTAGGVRPTVTVTPATSCEQRMCIFEVSGIATSSAGAGTASAAGYTQYPTVSLTTTEDGAFVLNIFGHIGTARALTEDAGFTLIQEDESGSVSMSISWKTGGVAGAHTCGGDITTTWYWGEYAAAFKAASTPAASPSLLGLMGIGA